MIAEIDKQLSQKIHKHLGDYSRSKWWKFIEFSGTQTGYPIVILTQLLLSINWRNVVVQTIQIIVITLIMMGIKPIIARKRPESPTPKEISHFYDQFSFPSGHATRAGVIVAVSVTSSPFWVPLLVWGIFVSISRVAVLHHYLGDVLAGFLAGFIFSKLTYGII